MTRVQPQRLGAVTVCVCADADAKETRRHKRTMTSTPTAAPGRAKDTSFRTQPARMIEVKPGYWISSFGCALDAGYGRFTPCDLTDGNAR